MKTQPTVRLVALKHFYGTRRLTAGDEFEARRDLADILVRIGRAKLAPEPSIPAPVPEPAAARKPILPVPPPVSHETSLEDLRAEAESLGVEVDGRWGVARLQHEIAQAKRE